MSSSLLTLTMALAAAGAVQPAATPAWMNTSLSADARADLVQAQMSEDEALQLVKGYYGTDVSFPFARPVPREYHDVLPATSGFVPGIARLGIPDLIETDAGEGIANTLYMRPDDRATALPSGLAAAATWNPETVAATGAVLGTEARDRGFNLVLDGGLNLTRDPAGGRTFEYAGEDPLLAGTIAGAMVRGIQSRHVISTLKHFAFNDQESARFTVNATIDESAARESDLLAFELAIEQGDPGAVMCAYNRYGGVYACENGFLLNEVLKGDWDFPGWVLSDWGGVHSTIEAANAGLDQESAARFDEKDFFGPPLKQALADGTVDRSRLHDMVHRILREMFAKGLIDDPPTKRATDYAADRATAQREAEEGIVLLKNAGSILPLARTTGSIAVIGSHADLGVLSGAGSSQVLPIGFAPADMVPVGGVMIARALMGKQIYDPPSPVDALRTAFPNAQVRFSEGDDISEAVALARKSEIAIVFARQWRTEDRDVAQLSLRGNQNDLIEAVAAANPRTIVVLETGGAALMPWLDKVPAVLEAWYAGSGGSDAIARILAGDVNPSGRLPITFPAAEDQYPRAEITWAPEVHYVEGADIGYKWFAKKNMVPLFPFGFGLSYTTFRIDNFQAQGGSTISCSMNVTNTGTREGAETAQIYATPPGGTPRLIGWSKVDLKPGETRSVSVTADPRLIARFDDTDSVWRVAEGRYRVMAGDSSASPGATAEVDLSASEIEP